EHAQFFVDNCSDPVFLLNAKMEIISASTAAKALLPHSSTALSSQTNTLSTHSGELHLVSVAQIFKPAEWPRISVWLEKIVEPSVSAPTHSLGTLLKSGHPAQLRAAPRAAGGFLLIVADAGSNEDVCCNRCTSGRRRLSERCAVV